MSHDAHRNRLFARLVGTMFVRFHGWRCCTVLGSTDHGITLRSLSLFSLSLPKNLTKSTPLTKLLGRIVCRFPLLKRPACPRGSTRLAEPKTRRVCLWNLLAPSNLLYFSLWLSRRTIFSSFQLFVSKAAMLAHAYCRQPHDCTLVVCVSLLEWGV